MIKELAPLLKKGDTLIFSVSRATDAGFRVVVTPKLFTLDGEHGPDRRSLNQPVVLEGTLEELDSPEFVAALNRFTASTTSLRQTIDDVEAAHKAAKDSKLKAPAKPAARANKPAKAKEDADEAEPEAEAETPEPVKPAKPPVEATATLI